MAGTKMPYRVWAVGIYLFMTNIKGVSSMRLHRELGIGQKTAWFMLHRLRLAFEAETGRFVGPVEVNETHIGGKRKNKPASKRKELTGRGVGDMTPIAGMKNRETNKVRAKAMADTIRRDAARPCPGGYRAGRDALHRRGCRLSRYIVGCDHEAVNHSVG